MRQNFLSEILSSNCSILKRLIMKKFFALVFFLTTNLLLSQTVSLSDQLKKASHDSIRSRILRDEIGKNEDFNVKLAYNKQLQVLVDHALASRSMTKEEERVFLLDKTKYLVNYGYIYQNSKFRDLPKALKYYNKSILISKQIGDDEGIANAYTNTGFAYEDLGNLPLAIDYYTTALKIYRRLGNVNEASIVLNNIAYVFQSQNKYNKAIHYFQECLRLQYSMKERNDRVIAMMLNNIGLCYNKTGAFAKADVYYSKSIALFKKLKNEYGIGLLLNNMGENSMNQYKKLSDKNTPEAKKLVLQVDAYFNQSLAIWQKQEDWVSKSITLKNMGMNALCQNKIDDAILFGQQSIEIAHKTGMPKIIRSGSELLYKAFKEKKEYQKAFFMLEQYHKLNDSLVNETNRKEIIEQGFAYEYEKKAVLLKEQAKIEKQKTHFIYCFVIAVLFLLVLLAIVWFTFYKKKQKIEKQLHETQLSLEIAEAERRRISADLHDDLGVGISTITLLSNRIYTENDLVDIKADALNIIKNTQKLGGKLTETIWELNAEHNNLEHLLLFIQKQGNMIFKDTEIAFSMLIPLEIPDIYLSSFNRKQIYLAVKECFNNSYKHAHASKVTCKVILNEMLVFEIYDDGVGFDMEQKLKSATSEGLKNLHYRLDNLKGSVQINTGVREGTKTRISIPLS